MCGIVGYVGEKKVVDVIVEGLRKLEYRGYDSAGIAVGCGPNGASNVADIAGGASAQAGGGGGEAGLASTRGQRRGSEWAAVAARFWQAAQPGRGDQGQAVHAECGRQLG